MNLNKIRANTYYIDGAVNLGVITSGSDAMLIDAALDDSTSRKVRRLLEENGLKLKAIIITHAHADHCGGAPYLVKATGAKVYAAMGEKSVLETPLLEPVYLFGGAYPPAALRTKFFHAPGVLVDGIVAPGVTTVAGFAAEIVDLKGHSLDQIGVVSEGVLFCADAVFAQDVLEKHGIPLHASIQSTLAAFERLEAGFYDFYLPSHGALVTDISPVVAANRRIVEDVTEAVLAAAKTPCSTADILAAVCAGAGYNIMNTGAYYLTHLTVMAYIGYLLDQNRLTVSYEDNRQFFCRA
ncbi:MAG: MBL fold metallo-hydrolase [Negativicutes bacterium]|nr:MBL fold metallo-hydrolase [Negativicutes bacterium]